MTPPTGDQMKRSVTFFKTTDFFRFENIKNSAPDKYTDLVILDDLTCEYL